MDPQWNKARGVIDKIKSLGQHAFIAGGFIRDCLLDRPARDIDLIMNCTDAIKTIKTFTTIDVNGKYEDDTIKQRWKWYGQADEKYQHAYIMGEGEFDIDGITIDFIGWNDGRYTGTTPTLKLVADINNWGICQCSYDVLTGEFYFSDQFLYDTTHKIHTLCRTGWGVAGSMKHLLRLMEKYNWPTPNIPEIQ